MNWTWHRIAAGLIAFALSLRIAFELLTNRVELAPSKLIFLVIPVAIVVACILYVFPVQTASGRQTLRFAAVGGAALGAVGLVGGVVGPMVFMPDQNQGPLVGILVTGPLGLLLGSLVGAVVGTLKRTGDQPPPSSRNGD